MRILLVVVAAVVLLAVALLALAPASLVVPAVSTATSDRITLADVDGTLWSGSGTLVGSDGRRLPLAWKTDGLAAARGKLHLTLVPPPRGDVAPRGDITVESGTVRARKVAMVVPAAWVASAFASRLPIAVGGDVDLNIDSLDWAAHGSAGEARVEWRGARLIADGVPAVDLGNVSAMLSASDDRLAGPIANDGGDLDVKGDVAAYANGNGEANVLVTPHRADDALARILAAIGTPEAGGYRVRARWQAR